MAVVLCASAVLAVGEEDSQHADLGFRIETKNDNFRFGPVECLSPVGMSLADGLMLKNGKPHFWIGRRSWGVSAVAARIVACVASGD